ncbi:potassium channel family protein [Paracraurococcus lichenis]|uniref:Potassium channel family protein n=1 Tax=Paracraurococcus lichenis TaxID=3064888 RepID=A0ABT9EEF1_9PROT|nr:potassium channel family protein [Paracraurococcus sp. LOR1-02]MDO9714368.1 potassium channel family protein [Paracraurococcus sp. LOR1-02]
MSVLLTALLGVILIVLALQDAFEVMLLPRRVYRRVRLVRLYVKATWAVWSAPARHRPPSRSLEAWLAAHGPLSLVLLFVLWSAVLILGFGLLQWALQVRDDIRGVSLGEQMYMSGATFFTLGYGDVVPHTSASRLLGVVEAGTGFGLIAVVIGYLPVLYQLFSRRESHVIRLDARAGTPPLATTLLCRHVEGRQRRCYGAVKLSRQGGLPRGHASRCAPSLAKSVQWAQ